MPKLSGKVKTEASSFAQNEQLAPPSGGARQTGKRKNVQIAAASEEPHSGAGSRGKRSKTEKDSGEAGAGCSRAKAKPVKDKRTSATGATVRYAARPSAATQARIQRALGVGLGINHRLFLVDAKPRAEGPTGLQQEFTILGATGNVYDVCISRHPRCSCPDFAKGNLCKHILFVMLRVLKVDQENPIVWQKALLASEVEALLGAAQTALDARVMAGSELQNKWKQMTGAAGQEESNKPEDNRRPVSGDCPICFEELREGTEALDWCRTCGNNIHQECIKRWGAQKKAQGQRLECVLCRSPWHTADAPGPSQGAGSGYVNLLGANQGPAPDLHELYGDNAMWIEVHSRTGNLSRRQAANLYDRLR